MRIETYLGTHFLYTQNRPRVTVYTSKTPKIYPRHFCVHKNTPAHQPRICNYPRWCLLKVCLLEFKKCVC